MTNDSLSKISNGLKERARLRDGLAKSPLAGLLNAPRSSAAVVEMLGRLKMKTERYHEWADGLQAKLSKLQAKEIEKAAKIPGLRADQRATIVRLAMVEHREKLRTEGPDAEHFRDRERIRAEINEMARLLAEVKADFASNTGALMRASLGSDDRRKFAADVATAGPLEIDGYLREAIKRGGTEGRALAAAVFARMDQLAESAPDVRGRVTVSKGEVADILIGRECSAAMQAIEEAQILHADSSMKAAEVEGREPSQLARDSLRMRKHKFAEQYPDTSKPEDEK